MSGFFNPDNTFFTIVNKFVNILYVSLLWTITSIPLFTIGPASAAMYYTCVKVIRKERGYVTRAFFHSFKENFAQGAISSVIFLVYAYIMYIDFQYASILYNNGDSMGNILLVAFMAISILMIFELLWIFPILSRFKLKFRKLWSNTLFIAIKHFPRTIVMGVFVVGILYVIYRYVPIYYLFFVPFILPGLSMLLRSFLVEPVLKKYLAEAEGTPEETGEDQWYRE